MSDAHHRPPPSLEQLLQGSPYRSYLYSYPHKTAHRPLEPAVALERLWHSETRRALFLYLHVPFCASGCAYCNLFALKGRGRAELMQGYVDAVARQARVVARALGPRRFARFAMGGGTPTALGTANLERLLDVVQGVMGADLQAIPAGVEVSPETASPPALELLRARGVDRVSVGVQSFVERELAALGRRQRPARVEATLGRIRELGFATLNIDLIYGIEGQDRDSLLRSLDRALSHAPEELFLYPLYVRPLTALGSSQRQWDDQRLELYRAGRDRLLQAGYRQLSMRMFRRGAAPLAAAPPYSCQQDGMVGLGCGARSYTETLHYSWPFAVGPAAVEQLLHDFIRCDEARFARAHHGVHLPLDDRRRRHVILSLLQAEGLDRAAYGARFDGDALQHLPQLRQLEPLGLASCGARRLRLTATGLERADLIGPWLHSARVQQRMDRYRLR